jgi:hypothetical protein
MSKAKSSYQYFRERVARGEEKCDCGETGRFIQGHSAVCPTCRDIQAANDAANLRRQTNLTRGVEPYRVHCEV